MLIEVQGRLNSQPMSLWWRLCFERHGLFAQGSLWHTTWVFCPGTTKNPELPPPLAFQCYSQLFCRIRSPWQQLVTPSEGIPAFECISVYVLEVGNSAFRRDVNQRGTQKFIDLERLTLIPTPKGYPDRWPHLHPLHIPFSPSICVCCHTSCKQSTWSIV